MTHEHYYAVIMAGGGGTRLWPLSRQERPKQTLQLLGDRTLFQIAVERLAPLFPPERILVVTAAAYAAELQRECPALPAENFIIEPEPRGTAAAIGLTAVRIGQRDPQGCMACLTADHYIGDEARFRAALAAAEQLAQQNYLVTLGIQPTTPSTGYGYIQRGEQIATVGEFKIYHAARFKEKPALPEAEAMFADGGYAWNSGMFIWRVERVLEEFARQLPELYTQLQATVNDPTSLPAIWATVKNTTIDYGIMEGARSVAVIPASGLQWNDVGSWDSLLEVLPPDEHGNVVISGEHVGLDTQRSLIRAESGRLVATIGISDLVIIDTADVVLVCPRDQAQAVRTMVEQLKKDSKGAKYQ